MITSRSLFIDTSGWGAFLDGRHALHQQVVRLYQDAARTRRGMVTTNYILTELVALFTSPLRLPRPRVISDIEMIMASPHVEIVHIDPALHAAAWALLKARQDKEWSLVDASSFIVMQTYGMTDALTTDHHFEQAQFTRLPVQP